MYTNFKNLSVYYFTLWISSKNFKLNVNFTLFFFLVILNNVPSFCMDFSPIDIKSQDNYNLLEHHQSNLHQIRELLVVYSILNDCSLSVNVVNELSQSLGEFNSRQVAQQDLHQVYQTYLDNLFNDLLHAKTNLNTEDQSSAGAVTPAQVRHTTSSELEPFFHALELTVDGNNEIIYAKLNPFELCHDIPGLLPVLEEQSECSLQLIFNNNQEDITVNLTPRKFIMILKKILKN